MITVTWFSPDAGSIVFNDDPYALAGIEGLSSTLASPKTRQGPGQIGASLTGLTVEPRVITLTVEIVASDAEEMWDLREVLSGKFVALPAGNGQTTPLGTLRLSRAGKPDIDILAVPRAAPDVGMKNEFYAVATIELFCPDPFYKDTSDSSVLLAVLGGFQFGSPYNFHFPLESLTFNVQQEITNTGTAPTSTLIRIYGACVNPRVKNITTGEVISVVTTLNAGDYIEINTAYKDKAVTYVTAAGVRSNALALVDLSITTFWQLKTGVNLIKFEADATTAGQVVVIWRQKYSGV